MSFESLKTLFPQLPEVMLHHFYSSSHSNLNVAINLILEELKNSGAQQKHPFPLSEGHKLSLTIHFPTYWDNQTENFQIFSLPRHFSEYQEVAKKFLTSVNPSPSSFGPFSSSNVPKYEVLNIWRIQNKRLWKRYYLCKEEIAEKNNGNPNEMVLFHGTRESNLESIIREGLDFRLAAHSGAIGSGVYFASNAPVSLNYCQGCNKVSLCKVLIGNSTQGQRGMRRPPAQGESGLYDSVHGTLAADTIYCVFDNRQCYIEWVIEFDKRN